MKFDSNAVSKTDINESEQKIVQVYERHVSCDGGNTALGHPKTYYEMGDEPFVICKYCDTRFELVDSLRSTDKTDR